MTPSDIAVCSYFALFLYSGLESFMFPERLAQKVKRLHDKLQLGDTSKYDSILSSLIYMTSILMCLFSIGIMYYSITKEKQLKPYMLYMFYFFIIFMVVVTLIYYPFWQKNKMIPFLTNLSLLSGIVYIMSTYVD